MTKHIETRGSMHGRRHGARIERITYAKRGLEISVRDSCLGFLGDEVEDGSSGGFGSCTGGGRYGDEGQQLLVNGETLAEWCVYKVEEVGIWVTGIQIHELSGVDDGASTNCEEGIRLIWLAESDGFEDSVPISKAPRAENTYSRAVLGLNSTPVINCKLDSLLLQPFNNLLHSI